METKIKKNQTAEIPTKSGSKYSYQYVDIAQIHDYLEANQMKYYQEIETNTENGQDYIMTYRFIDGKWEERPKRGCRVVDATLVGNSNPAQEQGSALTYARRYSLLMAFGLATEDDDGASLTKKDRSSNTKKVANDAEQELTLIYMDKVNKLVAETDTDYDEFLKYFKVKSNVEMTLQQLKQGVAILEKKKLKNKEEVF